MNDAWLGFLLTVFLAVVLLFWGLHAVWRAYGGGKTQQLAQRWESVAPQPEPVTRTAQTSEDRRAPPGWWQTLGHEGRVSAAWQRWARQAGMEHLAHEAWWFMGGWVLLSLGVIWWFATGPAGAALFALLTLALPALVLLRKRKLRMAQIERHLPDVLDGMARSMQAGHAFTSALKMAASDAKPPLSLELRRVFDEIQCGLDMRQALTDMAERVGMDDVRFFVIAVLIQHETGGNLAEILQSTANLIRERQKLRGVIRVLSGEGRVSAWILSLLPLGLATVLNLINPEFMSTLWTSPAGLQMLYTCMALMLAGIVWMWRLIDIQI
jgi:tight adherence protein B